MLLESFPVHALFNITNDADINIFPHQGEYFSTEISAGASAWELLTALENMPNVGTVFVEENPNSVTLGDGTDATTAEWAVTFTSAVGAFPALVVRLLPYLTPSTAVWVVFPGQS